MSRHWDDEDDDLDFRRAGRPRQSGWITAIGVLSIVLAALELLCGMGLGFCGIVANIDPQRILGPGHESLAWGFGTMGLGVANIVGAIGVLQRARWGE